MKLSFDILATWVSKFQELNTILNTPKKCRKQVIKTFSMREGWWYIGIKGDDDVKRKGTRLVIENEIDLY